MGPLRLLPRMKHAHAHERRVHSQRRTAICCLQVRVVAVPIDCVAPFISPQCTPDRIDDRISLAMAFDLHWYDTHS